MAAMGIQGGRTSMQAGGNKAGTSVRLTRDDIDRVVVNVPEVTRITPESFFDAPVSFEGRSYTWSVHGGNAALQEIQNLQLDLGHFYTAGDLQLRARVPKMRIVVDAGHGGWDLGTVGRRGLLEKDLVLEIAQRLGCDFAVVELLQLRQAKGLRRGKERSFEDSFNFSWTAHTLI